MTVLDKENKDVYLLGDFNINFDDRCASNLHVQEFKNILNVHSYFNLITKPTRIRGHSATILDNVFTNASVDNIACAGIFAAPFIVILLSAPFIVILLYSTFNSYLIISAPYTTVVLHSSFCFYN